MFTAEMTSFRREARDAISHMSGAGKYLPLFKSNKRLINHFQRNPEFFITTVPTRLEIKAEILSKVEELPIQQKLIAILDKKTHPFTLSVESKNSASNKESSDPPKPFELVKDQDQNTPVHSACFFGNIRALREMNLDAESLKSRNACGDTPLHLVAKTGRLGLFTVIFKSRMTDNVSFLAANHRGNTPFEEAIIHGQNDLAMEFYECCTSTPLKNMMLRRNDHYGNTPLHLCALHGNAEMAEFILEKEVSQKETILFKKNLDEEFPFHLACQFGHVDVAKVLVKYTDAKKMVLAENSQKDLPLHLAVDSRRFDIMKYLLSFEGLVKEQLLHKEYFGLTPYHLAARCGFSEGLNYMLGSRFLDECQQSRLSALQIGDEDGDTPLHLAIRDNQLSSADMILSEDEEEKITQTTQENELGVNPIDLAVCSANRPMLNLLLCKSEESRYRQLSEVNALLSTPIHSVCLHGTIEIYHFLTEGISKSKQKMLLSKLDDYEMTPLHLAATFNPHIFLDLFKLFPEVARQKFSENQDSPIEMFFKENQTTLEHRNPSLATPCGFSEDQNDGHNGRQGPAAH